MDYSVRVQHYFPAASLQTWATLEKQFTSTIYGRHTFVLFVS